MDTRRTVSPESALASDIFDKFCSANTLKSILAHYRQLCSVLRIKPTHFPDFYPRLKNKLCSWRAQGLWAKFEKRASHKCYGRGKACQGNRVLIIGSGPCGLRAAIEAQLLGAKVVLVEKRDRLSRNNVLHLWPFVITDLKGLGAKKFYGKFCAGSIDHISIRQLQCILLKVALLLGVEVHEGVSFEGLRSPTENEGWRCNTSPPDHPVSHYAFDCLIGADGRRNTLDGFRRKALRAKLAIAITANFINKHTEAEARVKEISGVSYIFNQKFFQELNEATGIDLENIVYYKDETHYFVMTAKKQSLLQKGVLLHDYADTAKLLSHENISTESLMIYALEAAIFSTENQLLNLEFAVNHYGQPDVAMFDFTAMYQAENACRVVQRHSQRLLMTLVGDSLLEPFWPTGSGCARGFLSSFDACWMLRSWAQGTKSPLEVMAERESIYRLLAQTTPENLNKEHTSYTVDPHSRYPNLNLKAVMPFQVKGLLDTDEQLPPDSLDAAASTGAGGAGSSLELIDSVVKKRRRDSVIAVDHLLSWLRDQVQCYSLEVNDVRDAFSSGDVLCAIIHRFRPDLIEFPLPSEENVDPVDAAGFRNQLAFDLLQEEYGLQHVMSGWESVQGGISHDFLSCVAYLSQVYEIFRGEIPQVKYARVESCEDLEDALHHPSSQHHFKYTFSTKAPQLAPTSSSKHHHGSGKTPSRKSRMSSSGRESREGDSEVSGGGRRHKKRRSEDRSSRSGGTATGSALPGGSSCAPPNSGREIRTTLGGHTSRRSTRGGSGGDEGDTEKNVPGLARDLEAKLKGRPGDCGSSGGSMHPPQKPKDLIRAIGKIEKTDWNVQLIEKKIAESKGPSQQRMDRDDKVPKWSREAFDDKREALKRKMEGMAAQGGAGGEDDKLQLFEETMRKLGSKLREGNTLEVGQRGSNKVSAMAEQLVHKLDKPVVAGGGVGVGASSAHSPQQSSVPRPVFEFPKKGGSECCHFCKERVYVVERMTAEGKFFHRNCFRCEYCNTALRVGNYVFDREGRYGDRFFCTSHYNTIWLYGWKKYDQEVVTAGEGVAPDSLIAAPPQQPGAGGPEQQQQKLSHPHRIHHHLPTATSQQILSEMDERGTTPERVEFENSVECASEDDLLSEMDEDEWTDRNFGASNADNLTPDEASDLSDDDITPEGITKGGGDDIPQRPMLVHPAEVLVVGGEASGTDEGNASSLEPVLRKGDGDSSDSDTEVASGEEEDDEDEEEDACSLEDEDELEDDEEELEDDEEEEEEEEEEEGGGSTTEIETDSEFAEDPPHSVPGTIPTIVVEEPEQIVTRMIDMPISHTQTPTLKRNPRAGTGADHHNHQRSNNSRQHHQQPQQPPEVVYHIEDLNNRMVEPVKKMSVPERPLPRVTAVPKKWEPLNINPEGLASKMSLELKKKYMQGGGGGAGLGGILGAGAQQQPKTGGGAAQSQQFRSVLDMISEQQKLLQPAAKPSATMQAFLDGAEKLKNKPNIPPLSVGGGGGISPKAVDTHQDKQHDHVQLPAPPNNDDGDVTPTPGGPVGMHNWIHSQVVINGDGGGGGDSSDNTLNMNRLNLEKSAAAGVTPVKISPGEKQDVGKEKNEEGPLLVNGGSGHAHQNNHHAPVMMLLSSEGLSQSETETQSTIIAKGGTEIPGLEVDDQKTPVAEKPFEHNLEPGKDREVRPLVPDSEEDEVEDGDTTETGDDPLSDESEEDDFEEDGEPHVKIEPPRVEIEDEFGGVTLAVDVEQEIDESIRMMSSSDSRDSLNSGVFLETELSDWVKEDDGERGMEEFGGPPAKDNNNGGKTRHHRTKGTRVHSGGKSKPHQPPLALDLEEMDFMDMDGLSSPEECPRRGGAPVHGGYTKLRAEEEQETPEGDVDEGQEQGPESILPDFSVVLRSCQPQQPSPNTLEREQRPTYSSDEQDESGRSSTPTVESLSKKEDEEVVLVEHHPPHPHHLVDEVHEAVNPVMIKELAAGKELPRKGPFSNARDSLDYRKVKGPPGPAYKDLYSTWGAKVGGVVGDLLLEEHSSGSSASTSTTSGGDKIGSPEMARKIEEIHKERAKQNDLIRSMVMGRIRKSPEKNSRRGSRGSLSPLGGAGVGGGGGGGGSSSSGSGSSEHVLRARGEEDADSRRSSQNSILSREEESWGDVEGDIPSVTTGSTSHSGSVGSSSIPHQKLVKSSSQGTSTTTPTSSSQQSPPAHPANQRGALPQPQAHAHGSQYEPVFSSSPRFRHRPKFESPLSPLSVYQSVTNPPTPVHPVAASQIVPLVSPDGGGNAPATTTTTVSPDGKSLKMFKSHSPSFYRSMPDLSAFLVSPLPGHQQLQGGRGSGGNAHHQSNSSSRDAFVSPDVSKWEHYKHIRGAGASSVDREKARQAARERARLKSDEELGLSPTDYANLKEKVRRKASVPGDDDVFATRPVGGSVPTTPVRETLPVGGGIFPSRRLARPMSDVFDAAFSLRPNVDFPITKTNPFLVSGGVSAVAPPPHQLQQQQGYPEANTTDNSGGVIGGKGEMATEWYHYHQPEIPPTPASSTAVHLAGEMSAAAAVQQYPPPSPSSTSACPSDDGFLHLKLRMSSSPPSRPNERKLSPEKAKSMGWGSSDMDYQHHQMPNYFSTPNSPPGAPALTSTPTYRGTPSSLTARADGNWFFDSKGSAAGGSCSSSGGGGSGRPRSNTLSDLNLSPSSLHSPGNQCALTLTDSTTHNPNSPTHVVESSIQGAVPAAPQTAQQLIIGSPPAAPSAPASSSIGQKGKALSTDTLLDSDSAGALSIPPNKGVSVPDISQHASDQSHQSPITNSTNPSSNNHNSSSSSNNNTSNNNGSSNSPQTRLSPERKNRKSKDRDRRRSLIQAVSDFFTIRGSSSGAASNASNATTATTPGTTASSSNNVSPTDKSSSQHTSSGTTSSSNGLHGYHHHPHHHYESEGVAMTNGKEKFSIFNKLTPTKILQSAKERRNSKSREVLMSPPPPAPSSPPRGNNGGGSPLIHQQYHHLPPYHPGSMGMVIDPNHPPPKPARAQQYLSQPEMVIQRLTQSPTTYKSHRTSRGSAGGGPGGYAATSGSTPTLAGLGAAVDHMATLSIVATPVKPARSTMAVSGLGYHHRNNTEHRSRMREMQEIQLQLESVEAQQRSLEARGVAVEKRIRGEEPDEKQREEAEMMEEWFSLVREKTRLARFEKELLVRAEELELEARKERLEEQLDNSLLLKDDIKSPEEKSREIELLHELRAVEEQRGKLLATFQQDMRQYENEDADLEAKIASSRLSPKESNV